MKKKSAESFLPLTHTTYYILLSLIEPLHGYGIMQKVQEMSEGTVRIGPGTLYGALSKLEKQFIIVKLDENTGDRKKSYQLTEFGRELVKLEYIRLEELVHMSKDYIKKLGGTESG
ncbi:PadR family transcriptional regulator [Aquibacillus halophilus]|uniref:PadR family transcriptional regulator n=1 Tax=Aquibacillus halophilus TaxID=930132 RepID=A0A6A8DFN9_9BACI|nr:PadR family transcriptional regulator [Aquibacillus halophilus]MRH44444.1 PadR family transcriptional regulator [Aquibacillus halophilus]